MKHEITHDYILSILDYNKDTGSVVWLKGKRKGKEAGSYDSEGYKQIKINGNCYRLARLLWFYVTGNWPISEIDHINRIKDDNKFINLRQADRQTNGRNRGNFINNTSGYTNINQVTRNNKNQYWRVSIKVDTNKHIRKYFPFTNAGLQSAVEWRNTKRNEYFGENK